MMSGRLIPVLHDQYLIPGLPVPSPLAAKSNLTILTLRLLTKVTSKPVHERIGVHPGVTNHSGPSGKEKSCLDNLAQIFRWAFRDNLTQLETHIVHQLFPESNLRF